MIGSDEPATEQGPRFLPRIPWLRLSAEFGVVFLGVTVGLLADDWRQSREEREYEVAALEGFLSELESDGAALARLSREKHVDDISAMWVRTRIGKEDVPADSAASRIQAIFGGHQYEPSRATYAGLRSSGLLALIRDDELRSSIIDYYENRQPKLIRYLEAYDEIWMPLRRALAQDWRISYPPGTDSYDIRAEGAAIRPLRSWSQFPTDPDLSYYLDEVGVLASVISRWAEAIAERSAEIQVAIRSQLER